jgi:hypothetical protein
VDGPRRPFFQTRFDIEKQFCFLADLYLSLVIPLHGVRGTENRGRDIANKGLTAAQNVTAELPSGPLGQLSIFCPRPATMAEYLKCEIRWFGECRRGVECMWDRDSADTARRLPRDLIGIASVSNE